jgi:hypothetical protein
VFGEGGETKGYVAPPERQHGAKASGDLNLFLKGWCSRLKDLCFFSFWRRGS